MVTRGSAALRRELRDVARRHVDDRDVACTRTTEHQHEVRAIAHERRKAVRVTFADGDVLDDLPGHHVLQHDHRAVVGRKGPHVVGDVRRCTAGHERQLCEPLAALRVEPFLANRAVAAVDLRDVERVACEVDEAAQAAARQRERRDVVCRCSATSRPSSIRHRHGDRGERAARIHRTREVDAPINSDASRRASARAAVVVTDGDGRRRLR